MSLVTSFTPKAITWTRGADQPHTYEKQRVVPYRGKQGKCGVARNLSVIYMRSDSHPTQPILFTASPVNPQDRQFRTNYTLSKPYPVTFTDGTPGRSLNASMSLSISIDKLSAAQTQALTEAYPLGEAALRAMWCELGEAIFQDVSFTSMIARANRAEQ